MNHYKNQPYYYPFRTLDSEIILNKIALFALKLIMVASLNFNIYAGSTIGVIAFNEVAQEAGQVLVNDEVRTLIPFANIHDILHILV
jgi:hypothetical protein